MDVHISFAGRRGLSGQIYRQLRAAVLDGQLSPGDVLPPTRELARRLSVARNTVSVAYDHLVAEGYLDSRVGSGTFVLETGSAARTVTTGSTLRPRPVWERFEPWPDQIVPGASAVDHDFRVGFPDARLFPYETWRRLLGTELRVSAPVANGYGDPAGESGLRDAIARHIGVSRAVRAGRGDVVVTNGIQQALDLICRVMLEPGDRVAVEDPGYPPARQLFHAAGAEVTGVPVDAEGLCVEAVPDDARLIYVTPSHQFPLGMPMSLRRRTALLDRAHRQGALVVEDDYDSEFRYRGRPVEPLQSLDTAGHVIYAGSFSKVMLPSLRVGFLVAPPPLRRALRAAKYLTDWATPIATQSALARFIDDGLFARHVRRMRREYETRHQRLTAELTSDSLALVPCSAGLHVTAFLHGDLTDPAELAAAVGRARESGVAVDTIAGVAMDPAARPGLVFGYGAIAAPDIPEGVRKLRHLWANT